MELPTGSVFATVPVGIPTELTTTNVLPGSEVVHRLNSFWQDQLTSVNSVTDVSLACEDISRGLLC